MKNPTKKTNRHTIAEKEFIKLQLLIAVKNLSTKAAVRSLLAAAQEIVDQSQEVAQ